ncbi:unnamed protein product [Angiostrongylus costaricensis]|uniref:Origin recognition complex subunit 1 n=1 Tax=Angiostrongylus costaricensis TaxID=334426 RepID=A0A0R3P9T4_ANGCS|nr:unnamed protein product [Angiostrongylus costaricensis]
MANRVLRPRQTPTAAVVSQTPLKDAMSEAVVGRRSLPRSAKVQAEREGYKSQLFSSDERHVAKKKNEMTPATKISHKIASTEFVYLRDSHFCFSFVLGFDIESFQLANHYNIFEITVRFRSVLQRNDGSLEYHTVGPESPWGMKRPVARIIPAKMKLSKLDLEVERDSPSSVVECEESSSSEDYSSVDSDEIDDSSLYSDEELDVISDQRRKSNSRKSILSKTTTLFASSKPRNGLQKTKKDTGKAGMLENLHLRLHTADVPERMLCREEVGLINYSRFYFIVKQLIRNKSCNKFTFAAVNAMELTDPKTIFVEIYNQIVDNPVRISPQAARRKLNTMFEIADKHRPPIVILVDELDQLCTKKQELIYDIFNWASVESARVSVIAIANTLDLPERMLSQRVTSRLGAARICFQPYEFQQIEHIILDRLKEAVNTVEVEAIQFAARKVAAVTGDLRKAMDILRHAIEIAIEKGSKRLLVEHVSSLIVKARFITFSLCSFFGKVLELLTYIMAEKTEDFTFAELHAQYISFAALIEGIEPLVESTLLSLIGQLCSTRLLVSSKGSHILRRRIRLGMPYQDAQSAIRIRENADKKMC